jgi:hypothetical protein
MSGATKKVGVALALAFIALGASGCALATVVNPSSSPAHVLDLSGSGR